MAWRIATDLIEAIVAAAAASPGVEVCGLLLGTRGPLPEEADPQPPFALSLSKGVSQSQRPGHVLRQARHEPGGGGTVTEVWPCRNVAADPSRRFEIDPAALFAAHRQARAGGPAILGCYHSHPSGNTEPSGQDAAEAAANGWLWIITTAAEVGLWEAVEHGFVHGRFKAAITVE